MPREREDAPLLWDMLEAARKIHPFIELLEKLTPPPP